MSKTFKLLVTELEKLPSVGKKSALKIAYHLACKNKMQTQSFINILEKSTSQIMLCNNCGCIAENELCDFCLDPIRDRSKVCLIEDAKDVFYIEESGIYKGLYYVLESADEDALNKLLAFINTTQIKEVIFAFSPSSSSDILAFYIEDKLKLALSPPVFSKIAQGIPSGIKLSDIDSYSISSAFSRRD